jgi:HAD superfamily hydrolase (TIGR01509 family)
VFEFLNIGSVLFDVDETLVSSSLIHAQAFKKTLNEYEIVHEFNYANFAGMQTKQVFETFGVSNVLVEAMTLRKQELTWDLMSDLKAKPGAIDTLKFLKKENIAIYTVSSGSRRNVQKSLTSAGLFRYVKDSIYAEDVSRGKPDPECYRLALQRFELNPAAVVAVEDSVAGCESAKRAGIEVIGISDVARLNCAVQYHSMVDLLLELRKK